MLRMSVVGQGCKGLKVQISEDITQSEDDVIITHQGQNYIIDGMTRSLLEFNDDQIEIIVPTHCQCGAAEIEELYNV